VICLDEMAALVQTHSGAEWKVGAERATHDADRGGRGLVHVHGAFEPATGQALIVTSDKRDSQSHLQLLEQLVTAFPAKRYLLIEDNLSIHKSRTVCLALSAWPEIQILFLPKYACWLNLIEPWWKQLRSLALKGRRFETPAQVREALEQAVKYWNAHPHPYIWKKKPQEQFLLAGGLSASLALP
jgi:transposase